MSERTEILCYGDSNTWGCIPRWEESTSPSQRYGDNTRWPCVAAGLLGGEYHIIEEGLNGRTTKYDLPGTPWKNGARFLLTCAMTHRPLDLVVIMLGTNDLHKEVQPEPEHLGDGICELIRIIRDEPVCGRNAIPPKIMIVSPPHIKQALGRVTVYEKFNGDVGRRLSLSFRAIYRKIADESGCYFLDAADYAFPSDADGVHLTAEGQTTLGKAAAETILTIFERSQI